MGSFYLTVNVKNRGPACSMPSQAVSLSNQIRGANTVVEAPQNSSTTPVIASGAALEYNLRYPESCPNSLSTSSADQPVIVTLHVGDESEVVQGAMLPGAIAICHAGRFSVGQQPTPEDAGTGPYSTLDAQISIPDQVSGPDVDYSVSLTNTGATAFEFTSCPTYTELASTPQSSASATYTLNCEGVSSIPPGGSVTFAMRLGPLNGPGVLKLAWLMNDGPSGVAASTVSGRAPTS